MDTNEIKAKVRRRADQMESGIAAGAAASRPGDDVEASSDPPAEPKETLRDIGRRIADTTKGLSDQAARQTRLRPLVAFGVAFAAGIFVARALRR